MNIVACLNECDSKLIHIESIAEFTSRVLLHHDIELIYEAKEFLGISTSLILFALNEQHTCLRVKIARACACGIDLLITCSNSEIWKGTALLFVWCTVGMMGGEKAMRRMNLQSTITPVGEYRRCQTENSWSDGEAFMC